MSESLSALKQLWKRLLCRVTFRHWDQGVWISADGWRCKRCGGRVELGDE